MGGLPAARIGDPSVHGGIVTVGFPTVLIGGKPASRIGDWHTCPMVTGIPHIGGPFILGSFTVLVGGVPQSRQTDSLICLGPLDALAMGCPTVLVGMAGGMGGLSAVLGGLMAGLANLAGNTYPKAELQSDGSIATHYNSFIKIQGTPEFQAKTVHDLNLISSTPSGQALMKSMAGTGKQLTIHIDTQPSGTPGNWAWTDPPPSGPNAPGYLKSDGTPGVPANTQVGYDPDRTRLSGPPGSPYNSAPWAQPPNRPGDVGLFHEMVHADDMMHGNLDPSMGTNTGPMAGTPIPNSELRAAGLPPFNSSPYSENTYRSDRGVAQRTFY